MRNKQWNAKSGTVYLVGAGPGDPGLLTLKAMGLISSADAILYDRLVSKEIIDLAREGATLEYVGKARRSESHLQTSINNRLVSLAQAGKSVVRLKSGDPFIFGRGGEEVHALVESGISFEIVPGVTAALGCAAYAGIPLTHRDMAQTVRLVTGHRKSGETDLNWRALVEPHQTLVFYMALVRLEETCHHLIQAGLPDHTPAAMIERGTMPQQRVVVGTLASLPILAIAENLQSPTLLIVGDVVSLQPSFSWHKASTT